MKKLLFLTVLTASINTCLPATTSSADAKRAQEEANKKRQEEIRTQAKQALKNKIDALKKCSQNNNDPDDQMQCIVALAALQELLSDPKNKKISNLYAKIKLSSFTEPDDKQISANKLHHIFHDIDLTDLKEIV